MLLQKREDSIASQLRCHLEPRMVVHVCNPSYCEKAEIERMVV
jgi:hypothetical protein